MDDRSVPRFVFKLRTVDNEESDPMPKGAVNARSGFGSSGSNPQRLSVTACCRHG